MGTITKQFQYELDVTGRLPANRIAEEHHTLTKPNWRTYHFIVPRCAPYFNLNVSVIHVDNSGNRRELREGVDWVPSYYFIGASRACAAPVYGGISFLNMNLVGQIIISYNTLGGEWVLDAAGLAQVLANYKLNPLITTWEQIANVPKVFPPEPHEWDLVDMVGEKEVVEAIYDIANAIRRKNGTSGSSNANTELNNHLNDKDNPHEVNKQQVGLGNVANYTIVPLTQAAESEANDLYTTPASVRAIIENAVGKALKAHIENKNNPHEVDTYTKREIDNALAGKVGTSGTAYDTERFKGKSYTELKAEVVEELKQILPSANLTAEDLRKITNEAIKEVKKAADLNAVTLENKSLEQVLTAAVDKVNDSIDTKLTTVKNQVKNELQTSGVNATTFNGLTPNAFAAQILKGKAADSDMLNGRTADAIQAAATKAATDSAKTMFTRYWTLPGNLNSNAKRYFKLFIIAEANEVEDIFTFEVRNAILTNKAASALGKELGTAAKVHVDLSKFNNLLSGNNVVAVPAEAIKVDWEVEEGKTSSLPPSMLTSIHDAFKLSAKKETEGIVVYLTTSSYSRDIIIKTDYVKQTVQSKFIEYGVDPSAESGTLLAIDAKLSPSNNRFGIVVKSVKGYTEEEKGAGKTYTVSKEVTIPLDTANTSTTCLLTYPTITSNDAIVPTTEKLVLNLTTPNSGQLANAVETADAYLHELTVITKGIAGTGVTELNKVGVVLNGKVTNPVDVNIHSSENMIKVRVLLTKTEDSNTRAATILEAIAQQIVL